MSKDPTLEGPALPMTSCIPQMQKPDTNQITTRRLATLYVAMFLDDESKSRPKLSNMYKCYKYINDICDSCEGVTQEYVNWFMVTDPDEILRLIGMVFSLYYEKLKIFNDKD